MRGNPRHTTSLGTAALWQEEPSDPIYDTHMASMQAMTNRECPDETWHCPCDNNATICTWFHRYITEMSTQILLCYALCLFYFSGTMCISPQTWSMSVQSCSMHFPLSLVMLTICQFVFHFCPYCHDLICCLIILHVLLYFIVDLSIVHMTCNLTFDNTQFTTVRVPLSV